mmetsp:Transcript_6262/g.9463  ORF Transcript_6262/g.9463 Transcript_6262/m.9463 type:complete len:116 (+) Transcript_6262:74-421(+)
MIRSKEDFFTMITTTLLDYVSMILTSRNERMQQIGSLRENASKRRTSIKGFHDLLPDVAADAGTSSSEVDLLQLKSNRYRELRTYENDRSHSYHAGARSLALDEEGGTYIDIPLD